jgi:hypothetical protein
MLQESALIGEFAKEPTIRHRTNLDRAGHCIAIVIQPT